MKIDRQEFANLMNVGKCKGKITTVPRNDNYKRKKPFGFKELVLHLEQRSSLSPLQCQLDQMQFPQVMNLSLTNQVSKSVVFVNLWIMLGRIVLVLKLG